MKLTELLKEYKSFRDCEISIKFYRRRVNLRIERELYGRREWNFASINRMNRIKTKENFFEFILPILPHRCQKTLCLCGENRILFVFPYFTQILSARSTAS